jgi:hypothetical protein
MKFCILVEGSLVHYYCLWIRTRHLRLITREYHSIPDRGFACLWCRLIYVVGAVNGVQKSHVRVMVLVNR